MMEFVSWDDDIPNMMGKKKCSKPPTSIWVNGKIFHSPELSELSYE
jgi:hypothetical protein